MGVGGTALPWWAVVLWTVIGSVLFLLMAIAWCIMFGDQCYCAPHCADDDGLDDTDDLVPRPPKRRFWMPRRGRYKSAVVVDEENTSLDELMMEPMTPARHGGSPGRPVNSNVARPDYHIDSE